MDNNKENMEQQKSVTSAIPSKFFQENFTNLEELGKLEDGWLGPGSLALAPSVKQAMVDVLVKHKEGFEGLAMAPLEDGSLRLEMEQGNASYIAEIDPWGGLYMCLLKDFPGGNVAVEAEYFDKDKYLESFTPDTIINFFTKGQI